VAIVTAVILVTGRSAPKAPFTKDVQSQFHILGYLVWAGPWERHAEDTCSFLLHSLPLKTHPEYFWVVTLRPTVIGNHDIYVWGFPEMYL
jgi:hypothetical protein